MSRDLVQYIVDMIEACDRIVAYVADETPEALAGDRKTLDAVVRNLQVLGEAAKNVPDAVRALAPGIAWRKIAGMRDVLIHDYFGIDEAVVWDAALTHVPSLRIELQELLARVGGES